MLLIRLVQRWTNISLSTKTSCGSEAENSGSWIQSYNGEKKKNFNSTNWWTNYLSAIIQTSDIEFSIPKKKPTFPDITEIENESILTEPNYNILENKK